MYIVRHHGNDPSRIRVESEDTNEVLVHISGPMSFAAAGAFIMCMEEEREQLVQAATLRLREPVDA